MSVKRHVIKRYARMEISFKVLLLLAYGVLHRMLGCVDMEAQVEIQSGDCSVCPKTGLNVVILGKPADSLAQVLESGKTTDFFGPRMTIPLYVNPIVPDEYNWTKVKVTVGPLKGMVGHYKIHLHQ